MIPHWKCLKTLFSLNDALQKVLKDIFHKKLTPGGSFLGLNVLYRKCLETLFSSLNDTFKELSIVKKYQSINNEIS